MKINDSSIRNSSVLKAQLENFKNSRFIHVTSLCKTSSYPKVYISSYFEQKIKELKQIKYILDSPQRKTKKKKHASIITKPNKTPKLYALISPSTPNYIVKLSHDSGCSCCNKNRLSFEANFDRYIQEKNRRTNNAQAEFKRLCKRPKTTGRDFHYNQNHSTFSDNIETPAQHIRKILIKTRCHSRKSLLNS